VIDEHTMIPDLLVISTHTWKRLNTQEKEWLQKAINFSIPYQRKLWIQSEKESLDAVIKAGVQVSYPEKKKFKEATYSMYNSFRKNFEMNQLIDCIQNEKN